MRAEGHRADVVFFIAGHVPSAPGPLPQWFELAAFVAGRTSASVRPFADHACKIRGDAVTGALAGQAGARCCR